jgi:hypothetical protein
VRSLNDLEENMNNKHQENGALSGPLIFTLPASSFVVILNFDCLDGTDRAAVAPKTRGSLRTSAHLKDITKESSPRR